MKVLVWDTSSRSGTIASVEGPEKGTWDQVRLISELTLNVSATHSEKLLWGIHQVLEASNWKLSEVDFFGVGVGPGSFTGLRIGITTARTLAQATNKPLIGVSSLAALARPAAIQFPEAWVIAATDACKGELFSVWGKGFEVSQCASYEELWAKGVEESVSSPEDLVDLVKRKVSKTGKWIAVGEGRQRYLEEWKKLPQQKELKPFQFSDLIQGRYLGQLVWESIQAGILHSSTEVHPRYVRASDAEIKLRKGILKESPRSSTDQCKV